MEIASVEDYIYKTGKWKEAVLLLREIISAEDVMETIKWGVPVYTVNQKNIIGIGAFKSYVGIWFHQGALLEDKAGRLVNASEGVTKAQRQWRFNSYEEVKESASLIRDYVQEAISNQKAGKSIKPLKNKPVEIPPQLKDLFEKDPDVKRKFESFSPSHQREFADYISEAKKEETRYKRLEKIVPMILGNKSLNDKYRNKS